MLSFFKKDVVFKIESSRGWTVLQFYTPLHKWLEQVKDAVCVNFSENFKFDDYVIGSGGQYVEISVHDDLKDKLIDFLINSHGFVSNHQNDEFGGLNGTLYHRKLTERQLLTFCKDFEKLKFDAVEESLEHVLSFDRF